MPGGVLEYQRDYVTDDLRKYLATFDARIGTLECALGDGLPFDKTKMAGKMNIIYSPASSVGRLKALNFNVVSLANNHLYDLGEEGLRSTIRILDEAGIKHCGAGVNIEEASRPAVLEIGGKRVAIFAYCQHGTVYVGHVEKATATSPGVNPLDIRRCVEDIRSAKQKYDYVLVMPHWGNEYQYLPTPECVDYARAMIDAGADGVFSSHTHQVQPLAFHRCKPIAYSMGNFMFPDYLMQPPRPIWYPESGDVIPSLPRIVAYPKSIDSPIVQVWRHLSRIGMLVECDIEGRDVSAGYRLVYTTSGNVVEFYSHPAPMRFRMKWMRAAVESSRYPLIYSAYKSRFNVARKGFHFLNRFVSRHS